MPAIQLRDSSLQQLAQRMLEADGSLSSQDITTLVDAVYQNDGRLSKTERESLEELLLHYTDTLESPEAKEKLDFFTQMSNSSLRDAAHRFASDGTISTPDARELESIALRDGRISRREKVTLKALLGFYAPQMEPGAHQLVSDLATTDAPATPTSPATPSHITPPPSTNLETLSLGAAEGRDGPILLSAEGLFALEQPSHAGGSITDQASEAIYQAAERISQLPEGQNLFAEVPKPQKMKALEGLQDNIDRAMEDPDPSNTANLRARSGAATTLLELARSAQSPDETNLREQAVDELLAMMEFEPVRGLRRSVLNNLEANKDLCSPEQLSRIDELKASIVPQRPPYDAWFENGNNTLKVKQYLHGEFYDETLDEYKAQGFSQEPGSSNVWVRTYDDPSGKNAPMTVRITVEKKNTPVFTEMDDDDKHIIFYSGHSNLGGHTKDALAWSEDTESTGDKLIVMSLCRGNQMAAAVSNRFPHDHQITTNDSVTSRDEFEMVFPMFEIMARRGSYEEMNDAATYHSWSDPQRAGYIFPHDTGQYNRISDEDQDGVADAWGERADRLFNVGLQSPTGTQTDLQAREVQHAAADLDGTKLISGIEFANTILHYHMENWDRGSSFRSQDDGNLIPAGWFDSDTEEPVRILEEKHSGETFYRVQVNSKYADQTEEALGALVGFEIAQHLEGQYGGEIDRTDMMRNFYLANEYLYFMGGNDYSSNNISKNLASRYDFPDGLDFRAHRSAHRSSSDHDIADMERIGKLLDRFQSWVNGG